MLLIEREIIGVKITCYNYIPPWTPIAMEEPTRRKEIETYHDTVSNVEHDSENLITMFILATKLEDFKNSCWCELLLLGRVQEGE